MTDTFIITLNQILKLFLFMALGYAFNKSKLYPPEFSSILSKLEVHVFMPALVFNTFSANFRLSVLRENSAYLVAGLILLLASFALALVLSRVFARDRMTRDVYVYAFTIPNLGYMGYPLVEAVFGETALFHMMILVLPFNLFIYTIGMYILNPRREMKLTTVLNPTMIALAIGAVFGIAQWKLPSFLSAACDSASACMAPSAMMLAGYVLAKSPLKEMGRDWKIYAASLVRLIGIPALAFAGMRLCHVSTEIILIACAMLAMPLGLNTVVFPEAFGGDSATGSKACFISNILGLVTIPLVFSLLAAL